MSEVERCASWSEPQLMKSDRDPEVKYVVVVSSALDGFPSCTCAAFQYSSLVPPTCKHVERARRDSCLWSAMDGPPQEVMRECPKCGKETEVLGARRSA